MSNTSLDARTRVDRYIALRGGNRPAPTVESLTPDASDRRYFRLIWPGGVRQVLAVHTGPIEAATLPFTVAGTLFQQMTVPVPRVIDHDDALGILAVDDLGDVTLQAQLEEASPAQRTRLYRQAIDIIETIQRRGRALSNPALLPYQLAFDDEKLTWELVFFRTHFLEGHRQARLSPADASVLTEEFAAVSAALAAEPRVMCHRDYHSRNLMVHQRQLWVIDFQDARLGPDTYDLVSLLRDAYVDVSPEEVDDLIAYFRAGHARQDETAEDFRRRFDLMAVQRTLKALGTFGFQASARGNPVYLQYVPRTLRALRMTLAGDARFARLRRTLATYVPELD